MLRRLANLLQRADQRRDLGLLRSWSSVVCMRRDFSWIQRQIGKLRESQMSLIGAETCCMNAACALGLCVAGLRGPLRKLSFDISACYAGLGRAPPVVHLGWVACSGDVFPDLSSEFEDPLYGVVNGHVCKRHGEHLSACRGYLARRRGDYRRLAGAGGPSTARKPYGGRDSARSNPSVCRRSMPSASSWRSWEPKGDCI